jgi:hypothetical protein
MAFDPKKTLDLIKGGLLEPRETWSKYLDENPSWQDTAIQLTGPLLIANVLLTLIFSRLAGGYVYFGYGQNFLAALVSGLVLSAVGFAVVVAVFCFLAGVFKGKADFSRAFAAVSLAVIPSWVAGIIGSIVPWVGWLIALAGGILALVYMYRIIPQALSVPEDKRVVHFVASIVCIIIINFIVAAVIGTSAMDRGVGDFSRAGDSAPVFGSGMLGELERQGRLMEAAQSDSYKPPENGMLSRDQVENFVSVMGKKQALQAKYAEEMQKLSEELEAKEKAGTLTPGDLAKAYGGTGSALGANNAEMEIVKTAGGNWAEHMWVKEQLRTAMIQQGEGSEALEHNFKLYEEYSEDLGDIY